MNEFTATLTLTKETKNTYVFSGNTGIPNLYASKSSFPDGAPEEIKVTITPVVEKDKK